MIELPLKAITLHRPWGAWVVSKMKPIENRSWLPPKAQLGQLLAIHAGQHWDPAGVQWARRIFGVDADPAQHHQGLIGIVRVVATVQKSPGHGPALELIDWNTSTPPERLIGQGELASFFGPFGWVLRDQVAFAEPIVCRGWQKIWRLTADQREAIGAALKTSARAAR